MAHRGSAEAKDAVNRGHVLVLTRMRAHLKKQQEVAYRALGYGAVWDSLAAAIKAIDVEIEATKERLAAP